MRTFHLLGVLSIMSAAVASVVVACGSDAEKPASFNIDASASDAARPAVDASSDAANEDGSVTCPVLAPGGNLVQATYIGGSPPDETGGALVPGTYDLTKLEVYLGTPEDGDPDSGPADGMGNSAQATFELSATTLVLAKTSTALGVPTPLAVSQANVSTESGVELVTDETCPGSLTQKTPFTASGNTISLHTTQTWRETYTRR